jgi:hypothetical protein
MPASLICSKRVAMADALEQLVDSLLWEGYALYPYTPGATKNATPTPFGIVYPPVYAAECPGAFDHARLECIADIDQDPHIPPAPTLSGTLRYLASSGDRHEAVERRIELGPAQLGERVSTQFEGGRLTLRSEARGDGSVVVRCCVHNTSEVPAGLDRAGALARSLISTQVVVRISAGKFRSPLDGAPTSVNTYPVLATEADDAVLGTSYVLPDHPQIAPESRGGLFDSTEIEEALLLHVQVLSDAERAEIERADPAVREMIARAAAATPEDIIALHGRVEIRDPETLAPPSEPPGLPERSPRRPTEAVVDGVRFRQGDHVRRPSRRRPARPAAGRPLGHDRERISSSTSTKDAPTIDGDPGQELMRETNRLLFSRTRGGGDRVMSPERAVRIPYGVGIRGCATTDSAGGGAPVARTMPPAWR